MATETATRPRVVNFLGSAYEVPAIMSPVPVGDTTGTDPAVDKAMARATAFTQELSLLGVIDYQTGKTFLDTSAVDALVNEYIEPALQVQTKEVYEKIAERGFAVWEPTVAAQGEGAVSWAVVDFLVREGPGFPIDAESKATLLARLGMLDARDKDEMIAAIQQFLYTPMALPEWDDKFLTQFFEFVTQPLASGNGSAIQELPTDAVSLEQLGKALLKWQLRQEWYGVKLFTRDKPALATVIAALREAVRGLNVLKDALKWLPIPGALVEIIVTALQFVLNAVADALEYNLRKFGRASLNASYALACWVGTD